MRIKNIPRVQSDLLGLSIRQALKRQLDSTDKHLLVKVDDKVGNGVLGQEVVVVGQGIGIPWRANGRIGISHGYSHHGSGSAVHAREQGAGADPVPRFDSLALNRSKRARRGGS